MAKAARAANGAQGASPLQTELARQILARIGQEGWETGAPVRELALARSFGVSRTPVRAALGVLAELGYVQLKPGHGFVLKRKVGGGQAPLRLPRSPLDQLHDAIMADRARGALPAEVFEAELMPRYGVSRGALRRVLMQLADNGLVKRQRGHGWRFAETFESVQAVEDSYRFRMIVECAGLREPTFVADVAELGQLRAAHAEFLRGGELDPRRWFDTNSRFHETLAAWSGNRFLLQAMQRQNALRRMDEYRVFPRLTPQRIVQSSQEHIAILDAIEAGDRNWAATLLHRHLELTVRNFSKSSRYADLPQTDTGSTGTETPARASIAAAASRQRSSR